jgi:hypothetical protein
MMQDASLHKAILRNAVQKLQREISFQRSEVPVHQQHLAELQAEIARMQAGGEIDRAFLQKIHQW